MGTGRCCGCDPRSVAPALLRWALGVLFLVGGIAKVGKLGGFVNGYLVPAFDKTILPGWLVAAYGYTLPFVEVAIGVLLIIGLCRTLVLTVTGLTLISLAFGQILLNQYATVANILLYVLMTAVAASLSEHDTWTLARGGCCRPGDGSKPT